MVLIPTVLLATGSLLLAACGDDADETVASSTSSTTGGAGAGGLSVVVEPQFTTPGSTLQATVRNDTGEQFTYGAAYGLEREVDGSFETVDLPPRAVIEIAYVAPPGKDGPSVEVQLPDDLASGTYRVVLAEGFRDGPLTGQFEVSDDG